MASMVEVARAVQVAAALLRSLGRDEVAPTVLLADNHVTSRFGDLVAKVRPAPPNSPGAEIMAREVAVARRLAMVGAPVVSPSLDPPAGPHFTGETAVTLWRHVEGRAPTDGDARAAAAALRAVHAGLATYPGGLPPLTDALDGCVRTLRDPAAAPRLAPRDRAFLLAEHLRLRAAFDRMKYESVALHGDARLGNALATSQGIVWLDFEAACVGPREWDLTQFPEDLLATLEPVDRGMLDLLRKLGGACVAVWCWTDPDPSPTVAEAAAFHLARLRWTTRRTKS